MMYKTKNTDQNKITGYLMTHKFIIYSSMFTSRVIPNCGGPNTFMNRRAIEKIHNMARSTNRLGYRIEDIYYNGIIRLKANVTISKARNHQMFEKSG